MNRPNIYWLRTNPALETQSALPLFAMIVTIQNSLMLLLILFLFVKQFFTQTKTNTINPNGTFFIQVTNKLQPMAISSTRFSRMTIRWHILMIQCIVPSGNNYAALHENKL
jgi:hypothetical protein